jgi:hypothetical protein
MRGRKRRRSLGREGMGVAGRGKCFGEGKLAGVEGWANLFFGGGRRRKKGCGSEGGAARGMTWFVPL